MAHTAIEYNRVKLVDNGAWVVFETDHILANTVTPFQRSTALVRPLKCVITSLPVI